MDTDIPLPALALSLGPLPAVLLVLGGVAALGGAFTAAASISSRVLKPQARATAVRALLATLLSAVLSGVLTYFGLAGLLATPAGAADWRHLFALLAALGPALGLPAVGALLAAAGPGSLRPTATSGIVLGQALAELLTCWLPRPRLIEGNGNGHDEPDFEITMAGGEELEAQEREYIGNILELGETTAHEVMKPRTAVEAIDLAWEPTRILQAVAGSHYSRFPVYDGSIDNVTGILHLRELLEFMARGEELERLDLRPLLREPYFVPESRKVDDVLKDLQRKKSHLAVVIDEYGGTAGILTIEDLLEEIVGEIQDEYDEESKLVHEREDGSLVVGGQLPLNDLNELLQASLSAEDVDTLGGFVVNALGRIPSAKDQVEMAGLRLTVLSVDRHRVSRVLVERLEP